MDHFGAKLRGLTEILTKGTSKYQKDILTDENNQGIQHIKVTTDTNKYYSCMTKHNLPYSFNICYRIYLKLNWTNGPGMLDAIIMHSTIYVY